MDASSVHLHLMTNEILDGCGIKMYCIPDQCLTAVITTESDVRQNHSFDSQPTMFCFVYKNNVKITYMDIKYNLKKYNTLNK